MLNYFLGIVILIATQYSIAQTQNLHCKTDSEDGPTILIAYNGYTNPAVIDLKWDKQNIDFTGASVPYSYREISEDSDTLITMTFDLPNSLYLDYWSEVTHAPFAVLLNSREKIFPMQWLSCSEEN
jgi:hypothetical protein